MHQETNCIQVSYVRLNLKYEITSYNQKFVNFFGLEGKDNLLGQPISRVISCIGQKLFDWYKMEQNSFLIFRNHDQIGVTEPLVSIIYVTISKEPGAITIRIVNWLNWIWQLNSSLNSSYNMISNMDESKCRKKIGQLLEMYWFKALSPLLMHIPNGFIGMVSSWTFFDILKIFNNKRGNNQFSKDYSRDMLSRVRHSIKKDCELKKHVEVSNILKDNMLINLRYNNEIFIPHSILGEDIVLSADKDMLLEQVFAMPGYKDNVIS